MERGLLIFRGTLTSQVGPAGSSQGGQGPIIRETGARVPCPGEMGESGEGRGAQRARGMQLVQAPNRVCSQHP